MKNLMEEDYGVFLDGQPSQDLLILTHFLCVKRTGSLHDLLHCLKPASLQSLSDCSQEEQIFLRRCVNVIEGLSCVVFDRVAEHCLEQYPEQVTSITPTASHGVSKNELNAWRVVLGQQNSLRALITLTT